MTTIDLGTDVISADLGSGGHSNAVQLGVGGELDTATARQFARAGQRALTGHHRTTLAIDMSQVTFIDAAGIGALVAIRSYAQVNDNIVVLIQPARCVLQILELTGLATTFVQTV